MQQAESGCFYAARKERRPESLTMRELSSGLGFSSASVPVGCCPGVGDNFHSHCLTVLCGEGSSSSTRTLTPCGLFYQICRSSRAESYLKKESEPTPALFYCCWFFFFYIFATLTSCRGNNSCILILLLYTRQSQFLLLVNSRTAQGPQPNRGPHSCNISCGWCFLVFWSYILWTAQSHDEWHKYDGNDPQLGHH